MIFKNADYKLTHHDKALERQSSKNTANSRCAFLSVCEAEKQIDTVRGHQKNKNKWGSGKKKQASDCWRTMLWDQTAVKKKKKSAQQEEEEEGSVLEQCGQSVKQDGIKQNF